MKKFIILLALAFGMIAVSSCTSCTENGSATLIYNAVATADGKVDFTWFNGGASIDGAAKVFQSNDTTSVRAFNKTVEEQAIDIKKGLVSSDAKVADAARYVYSQLNIKVNGVEGEYHLAIKGYVKYGNIVFAIDEYWPR